MESQSPINVYLITGFLGAGKTTLLNHLLKSLDGTRNVVIENEFGKASIDGNLIAKQYRMLSITEGMVLLSQQQHKGPGDLPELLEDAHAAVAREKPAFEDHRAASATRWPGRCGPRRWNASTMISRASGAAAPDPLDPCSTITDRANSGLSCGA